MSDYSGEIVGMLTAREQAIAIAEARQAENLRMLQESPENARCACGNITRFIGHDDRGFGGPEVCTCRHFADDPKDQVAAPDVCACITHLEQPYTVLRNPDGSVLDFDYERFEGGGSDAEIGGYTRINCAVCGQEVYRAPDLKPEEVAHAS